MFKFAGIIFGGALVLLANAATLAAASDAVPKPIFIQNGIRYYPLIPAGHSPVTSAPVSFPAHVPPAIRTNVAPAANIVRQPAPVLTWTALNRWAVAHRLGKALRLASSPMATYSISSANGVMVLAIGSRDATWNGIQIHLGFEPEMIDGEIFLHELDLQKNLEPLLCAPPLAFGANRIIVIDPGHGGMNPGTHSVLDGRFEKEFTLDLAKRLKPLLERDGWQVFLTRTGDYDLSLSNRVAFAETHHADVFISLHFNSAAPGKTQNGLETYCLTPRGMPSTLTRGFADPWFENLPNNNFDTQNLQLAVRLHAAILRGTGETDRGVRRARFIGVLRGQNCPAILIENGFLSNPREAKRIESPDFRQKLAETIAAALK